MVLASTVYERPVSLYSSAGGNWPHCPFEAWARGGGRPVSVKSFNHNLGTDRAVQRLLGLCALVALSGIASRKNAEQVVLEEAAAPAVAAARQSVPGRSQEVPNHGVVERTQVLQGDET